MFDSARLFWLMGRRHETAGTPGHYFGVEGSEPNCAGLLSGAALMGIGNGILKVLVD
jgi:hypothetical protein